MTCTLLAKFEFPAQTSNESHVKLFLFSLCNYIDVPCTSDDDSISNHSQHTVTVVHPVSASLPGQRKRIHLSNNSRRVTSSVDHDLPKHNSWVGRAISGPPIPLLPSLFCNVPPTIYFTTEGEAGILFLLLGDLLNPLTHSLP